MFRVFIYLFYFAVPAIIGIVSYVSVKKVFNKLVDKKVERAMIRQNMVLADESLKARVLEEVTTDDMLDELADRDTTNFL